MGDVICAQHTQFYVVLYWFRFMNMHVIVESSRHISPSSQFLIASLDAIYHIAFPLALIRKLYNFRLYFLFK